MQQKNIFILIAGLRVGGAEKFLVSLVNALDPAIFRLTVISFSHENPLQAEFRKDIRFHNLGRNGRFDVLPLLRLRKMIKEHQPETFFCVGFFSFFLLACAGWLMKMKVKRIVGYHATIPRNKKEDRLMKLYLRCLKKNDVVVTVSNNQAAYTAARYAIPNEQFRTIHNGVDTTFWTLPFADFKKDALRAQYQLPADAYVIIKTAVLRPEKNHHGAIRALHLLHTTYGLKAYLLLVGDGPMKDSIREMAAGLDLTDYVRFSGFQQDVRPFYWISNLFVLCSFTETFSIAALEAMACGLPCVLTNVGGAQEMIVAGKSGFVCAKEEREMAIQWFRAYNTGFSPWKIHAITREKFEQSEMIKKYADLLS